MFSKFPWNFPTCLQDILTPPKKDGVETIQEVRVSTLVAMSKGYCQNTEIVGVSSFIANFRSKAMKISANYIVGILV